MDTAEKLPDARAYNGSSRQTGQKTVTTAFRIFETQHQTMRAYFGGNASAIIRLLLAEFLAGNLPDVEAKYNKLTIK